MEAVAAANIVTVEALWKRYRRATVNRDTSKGNKDTSLIVPETTVYTGSGGVDSNRDGLRVNRDTSNTLFIPPETS
ncbi:hypothetical protein LA52FAK_26430 [Desulforhopalus sp. 52FAK]